MTGIDLQGI